MRKTSTILLAIATLALFAAVCTVSFGGDEKKSKEFKAHPIGYVRKTDGRTTIILDKKTEPGPLEDGKPVRDLTETMSNSGTVLVLSSIPNENLGRVDSSNARGTSSPKPYYSDRAHAER